MRSIQEVGTEILENHPAKLYVFTGSEYGIKMKYVELMKHHYGSAIEAESVEYVFHLMTSKRLIPLKPCVYIVRYDEDFISKLSDKSQKEVDKIKMIGTLVVIYEQSKHATKLDKYLPNYTVSIDPVNSTFLKRYLRQDFPKLPDNFIDVAIKMSKDYNQCKLICGSMNTVPIEVLCSVHADVLMKLLGHEDESTDIQVQLGVAARNFSYLCRVLEDYSGTPDSIVYDILTTMTELEKCFSNSRSQSDFRQYTSIWTLEDIYYMFCHAYDSLKKLRSLSYADGFDIVYFLLGLLQQPRIPKLEVFD